jgi:hypothetical protein
MNCGAPLQKEATKPAALNFLQQQARFDDFIEIFNQERPHEALAMTTSETLDNGWER